MTFMIIIATLPCDVEHVSCNRCWKALDIYGHVLTCIYFIETTLLGRHHCHDWETSILMLFAEPTKSELGLKFTSLTPQP